MPTKPEKQVTPRIWAEGGWIKCKVPFTDRTKDFANDLKNEINWKLRQWSKHDQTWLVDPACLEELIQVAKRYYPDIRIMGDPDPGTPHKSRQDAQKPRPEPRDDGPYKVMANLLEIASTDTLKRIYRALAADVHPDHGGEGDTLRRLNVAWDRIRKERGRK